MMKRIALVAVLMLVAGCVTTEQRAARKAEIAKSEHQECINYGAQIGAEMYMDCRLSLAKLRAQSDAARTAAWRQNMQNLGASISSLSARNRAVPIPTTMNCTTTQMGVYLHVNCF